MTPQYYVIRLHGLKQFTDLEEARKVAESVDLSPGEGAAIVVPIGITQRSVTATWLDQQDKDQSPPNPISQWSWPTLPPGHSYLNPENLTVEQLGDGWRPLCTLDGDVPRDSQVYLQCAWDHSGLLGKTWLRNSYVTNVHHTYRTRAPIPTLPSNP